jgi:peptidyl-prolyl cis-trans isomerase B (cyclophilin B)
MAHHAIIHTSKWPIRLHLHADKVPHTVWNFVTLARNGYYDNLQFHRVIEDFMIQWWCPLWTGTGGPWYHFGDEFHPELRHVGPWVLSMANSWPNTNGSQFFITHVETPWLDGKHSVFGKVVDASDLEIVNIIQQWDTITSIEIIDIPTLSDSAQNFANEIEKFLQASKK